MDEREMGPDGNLNPSLAVEDQSALDEIERLKRELSEANARVALLIIQSAKACKKLTDIGRSPASQFSDDFKSLIPPLLDEVGPFTSFQVWTHPLELDVVLRHVFGYLGASDLGNCRLVNKTWRENAALCFKRTHFPVVLDRNRTIDQFVHLMNTASGIPFSNFSIKNEFGQRIITQLESFGSHVKTLKLDGKYYPSWVHVNSDHEVTLPNIVEALRQTPDLETLVLCGIRFAELDVQPEKWNPVVIKSLTNLEFQMDSKGLFQNEKNPILLTFQRIFSVAPNIHKITVQVIGQSLLGLLLSCVANLQTLQHLDLGCCVTESNLKNLTRGVLHLTFLKMSVHLDDCRLLQEFLTYQARTLYQLELHVSTFNIQPMPAVTLPTFPLLTHLKFTSAFYHAQKIPFERRREGNEFPALKELTATPDMLSQYFPVEIPTVRVESLTCDYIGRRPLILPYNDFLGVQKSFPNLTKLHLKSPTEQGMKLVLKNTAQFLQHLNIDLFNGDQTNVDAMLTGVRPCSWITDQFQRLEKLPAPIRGTVTKFFLDGAPNAGLSEMKALKILEIRCSDDPRLKVTDVTGYLALHSMPPLEYLGIYKGWLSTTCVEELRKIHKTVVIRS